MEDTGFDDLDFMIVNPTLWGVMKETLNPVEVDEVKRIVGISIIDAAEVISDFILL